MHTNGSKFELFQRHFKFPKGGNTMRAWKGGFPASRVFFCTTRVGFRRTRVDSKYPGWISDEKGGFHTSKVVFST